MLRRRALATVGYNYILQLILLEFFSLKIHVINSLRVLISFFFLLSTGYDPPGGVKITPLLKAALNDLKPRANSTKHKVALKLLLKSCTQELLSHFFSNCIKRILLRRSWVVRTTTLIVV